MKEFKKNLMVALRPYVGMSMFFLGVVIGLSSIILYLLPGKGVLRRIGDPAILGLTRTDWVNLHVILGFVAAFFLLIHLFLNWRALVRYFVGKEFDLKNIRKEAIISFLFVLGLSLFIVVFKQESSAIVEFGKWIIF